MSRPDPKFNAEFRHFYTTTIAPLIASAHAQCYDFRQRYEAEFAERDGDTNCFNGVISDIEDMQAAAILSLEEQS